MGQIGGQTFERKTRIFGRAKMFRWKIVVLGQENVEVHQRNANAFAELNRSRLAGQTWSGRLGIESSDGWTGFACSRAKANKAAVDFAVNAGIQPLVERLHRASTHDGLRHSIEGTACRSGRRTQTTEGDLVQRNRLRVQIDDGVLREFREIFLGRAGRPKTDSDWLLRRVD